MPPLAFRGFWPQISTGRLAVDEPLANRVRSGRKEPYRGPDRVARQSPTCFFERIAQEGVIRPALDSLRRVFRESGSRFCLAFRLAQNACTYLRWNARKLISACRLRETIKCGSIDDRRWRSLHAPQRSRQRPRGRFRAWRPAGGRQALSRAGEQKSSLQF